MSDWGKNTELLEIIHSYLIIFGMCSKQYDVAYFNFMVTNSNPIKIITTYLHSYIGIDKTEHRRGT